MKVFRISVVVSFILSVFAAISMAGAGPHAILLSTNQTDRLTQVEVGYDGDTVYEAAYNCRRTNPATGDYNIYFNLNDSYIFQGNYPIAHISIAYYDLGTSSFNVQYDGTSNVWQSTSSVQLANTGQLKWVTFDLWDAYFGNRQHSALDFRICGGTSSPVYISTVYVWCRKETAGSVSVSNGQFTINNERFVMVGANYIPPYQTQWGNAEQVWKTLYNSSVIERDFTNMEHAGVNAIRTFLAFWDYICPSEGSLDSTVIANIQDFYQRAENHGIKVQLCVGGFPTWLGSNVARDYGGWPQYADLWSNFEIRKERADFLVQLINDADLGDYDSFLSFDLENEAAFAYAGGTAQEFYNSLSSPAGSSNSPLRAWNQWVNAKYGSLSNAYSAWGYQGGNDTTATVFPEIQSNFTSSGSWDKKIDDYYAFVADCFTDTVAYTRSRVQSEALSRAMITVDCVIRGLTDSLTSDTFTLSILSTDVKRISQACDYISLNIYNGFSTDPAWYRQRLVELVSLGLDKPVILAEFGYPAELGNTTALENERIMWAGMVDAAAEARVDGCLGWMWIDTLDTTVADADFGILYCDTSVKPAYWEFQKRKVELLVASEPVANCTLEINMDGYVSPIEAFYSQGRDLVVNMFNNNLYPDMITLNRETPVIDTIYHLPVESTDPVVGSLGINATRGAIICEDTIPDFMVAGLTYDAIMTVMNVGTATWTAGTDYRLGTPNATFGAGRWYLSGSDSIATGYEKTFSLALTAPATAGTYSETWRMLQENVAWFGQGHPHSVKVIAKPALAARIISHDIPSEVSPNQVFTVNITVRNEGTTTWTQAANFRLGAVYDSDPFASTRHLLSANDSIASGQTKTFSFTMTAPSVRAVYQTDWMMLQENVAWFGQKIDIEVCVD